METSQVLTPRQVLETIRRLAPQDTIVSTDVGQHQMWSIQHFHFDYPGQLLTSGGFGTMGFGLGAAIGAQAGNPDKVVVHTTGDGCFRMNCHELWTVEHYHLPIITVIFNNGSGVPPGQRDGAGHSGSTPGGHGYIIDCRMIDGRDGSPDGRRRQSYHRIYAQLTKGGSPMRPE